MRQLELVLAPERPEPEQHRVEWFIIGNRRLRLVLVRNRRARRYVLRVRADGAARVTIPRGGSAEEGRNFARRNLPWLETQLLRQAATPPGPKAWLAGLEILLRGQPVRLEAGVNGESCQVRFGPYTLSVSNPAADLRPELEAYLWGLAARELPPRVLELASRHQLPVRRVSVRNQKSRWGSCSRRGTICLNWRLVQAPETVRDYIILHELAHLRHLNHSRAFWKEVARFSPDYRQAEAWLKKHGPLLR